MKSLLNPKWIFFVNTLPILILLFLGFQEFSVIKTLLKPETVWLWKSCTYWLLVLGFLNLGSAAFLVIKNYKIKVDFALFMLISNVAFLYLYYYFYDELVPRSVPQWMLSSETMLYVGTFLMPTLAYSLFILVVNFTPENKTNNPWKSFGIAVLVPIFFYILVQLIFPLYKHVDTNYNDHFIIVLISVTLFFLFFLVRGIFIMVQKKSDFFYKYQLVWKIFFAIVLPAIGLLVNSGLLFSGYSMEETQGIFGNFNSFWFYFLVIFNGILICIPNLDHRNLRFILFILRSVTFAVTVYFFIVFLPFLPFSVIVIVAIGLGFLMLSPLVLFVIHVSQLVNDFSYLKRRFPKNILRTISIIGFLVIPVSIHFSYLQDKKILNETLEYVYTPNYSKKYNINLKSLRNTLNIVTSYKERRNDFLSNKNVPYLTSYFNWLVFNNLTISESKITTIEKVFFNNIDVVSVDRISQQDNVKITNIATESTFDQSQKAWKTWVDFEITDQTNEDFNHEFATTFNLPEGCFISDYYLMIGKRKEFGILSEKKSAMWIYNQITSENKDPGILNYLTGNKISFKVFPFVKDEVRKTGIEFIHKEPLKISIENQKIQLGIPQENAMNNGFENSFVKYISSVEKQKTIPVTRKPYFVFLIDASDKKEKWNQKFLAQTETLKKQYPDFAKDDIVYFVNTYSNIYPNNDKKNTQKFEGGYFLDRAIRKELVRSYQRNESKFPVFIAVTNSIQNAVLNQNFANLEFTFPENKNFYHLENNGTLTSFSLLGNPTTEVEKNVSLKFDKVVLPFKIGNKTSYLANDNEPSFILKSDLFQISKSDIKEKNWETAILMQAKNRSEKLHPEIEDEEWISAVENSFRSKIMTPVTSYLVVENEAQKAALKRKQAQILNGGKTLDAEEEMQQMSEPNLYVFGALLLVSILFKEYRKRKINLNLQSKR